MLDEDTGYLQQTTVTQGLVREIRERVLSGVIRGGEPLKQELLAKQFGVSRIPVRESLLQLEAEGLVRFTPHKGAIATELSVDEAKELFHVRMILETDIFAEAFKHLSEAHLAAAALADAKYDEAIERGGASDSWGQLNWNFHKALYSAAERTRTMTIIKTLHTLTDRYQRIYLKLTGGVPLAEADHRLILDACRRGDRKMAIDALRTHISGVGQRVIRALTREEAYPLTK